jgi:hydrogenase-4 membrane subunit HyfE
LILVGIAIAHNILVGVLIKSITELLKAVLQIDTAVAMILAILVLLIDFLRWIQSILSYNRQRWCQSLQMLIIMLLLPRMDESLNLSRLGIVVILLRVPVLTTLAFEEALSTLVLVMSNLTKR